MQKSAHAPLIAVLRPGALGDFILTLPALTWLREWVGAGEILLALSSGPLKLARDMKPEWWDWCVPYEGALVRDILAGRVHPDLTVAVQPELDLPESRCVCIPPFPPVRKHQAEHLCETLAHALNGRGKDPAVETSVAPNIREDVVHAYNQWKREKKLAPADAVVIHPGSGSEKKNWPEKNYAQLISVLEKDHGTDILLVEGPAEPEKCDRIAAIAGKHPTILREIPTAFLFCLLRECRAYVGNDSGISHLAGAAGCECVVLFGPTRPEEWAPKGKNVRVVQWDPADPLSLAFRDVLCQLSFWKGDT